MVFRRGDSQQSQMGFPNISPKAVPHGGRVHLQHAGDLFPIIASNPEPQYCASSCAQLACEPFKE